MFVSSALTDGRTRVSSSLLSNFFHFHAVLANILQNNRLPPAPPDRRQHLKNPGSATESGPNFTVNNRWQQLFEKNTSRHINSWSSGINYFFGTNCTRITKVAFVILMRKKPECCRWTANIMEIQFQTHRLVINAQIFHNVGIVTIPCKYKICA